MSPRAPIDARPQPERAILVGTPPLDELRELTATAGASVVEEVVVPRGRPHPATYIGKGKAEEVRVRVVEDRADVVIFDDELSPSQSRNLEEALECKVVDRTGLILDIFASRARTREGKLQVELAQLNYRLTRLTGSSTYLSRLGGGIGTRGPGETRLEMDRRQIRARIAALRQDIDAVRAHRQLHRERRRRDHLPVVSLVGYTNAGKSTLFRALSGEETLVSNRLFSTLDTLTRRIRLAHGLEVLVSDTVGFIRKLPHQLVTAFRATLEEVTESDLILHVLDASDPDRNAKFDVVVEVLNQIGAGGQPRLTVFNKLDLLDSGERERIQAIAAENQSPLVSAVRGTGVPELASRIASAVAAVRA